MFLSCLFVCLFVCLVCLQIFPGHEQSGSLLAAGFSVGELAALVFSEAISTEEGMI